jgi:hypothetical protein
MVVAHEIEFDTCSIFDVSADLLTKPLLAVKHTLHADVRIEEI